MFAIFGLDNAPINASFKVADEDFEKYAQRPGMKQAPYFARLKWIAVDDISILSDEEWKKIRSEAYELIKEKLPKKLKYHL